jgi:hypothetical protein
VRLLGVDAAVRCLDHGGAALVVAFVAAYLLGAFLVPLADSLGDGVGAELVIT